MPSYERIRARREDLGLSLDDVVRLLQEYWPGIDKSTLSRYETGQRRITSEQLPIFAKVLQCHTADLVDDPPK